MSLLLFALAKQTSLALIDMTNDACTSSVGASSAGPSARKHVNSYGAMPSQDKAAAKQNNSERCLTSDVQGHSRLRNLRATEETKDRSGRRRYTLNTIAKCIMFILLSIMVCGKVNYVEVLL